MKKLLALILAAALVLSPAVRNGAGASCLETPGAPQSIAVRSGGSRAENGGGTGERSLQFDIGGPSGLIRFILTVNVYFGFRADSPSA